MPQMSPMNWLLLMVVFSLTNLFLIMKIHFMKFMTYEKSSIQLKSLFSKFTFFI